MNIIANKKRKVDYAIELAYTTEQVLGDAPEIESTNIPHVLHITERSKQIITNMKGDVKRLQPDLSLFNAPIMPHIDSARSILSIRMLSSVGNGEGTWLEHSLEDEGSETDND
ncbi:hypothetical protein HAX54_048009 [Datura stramonium]|uniref:Uncharacterized protein n=1 Tax=Datura stramonium TaxID=4076 RepID=A0ABS8SU05_DATST|nr:hypothetical protein [Datura stramonium]